MESEKSTKRAILAAAACEGIYMAIGMIVQLIFIGVFSLLLLAVESGNSIGSYSILALVFMLLISIPISYVEYKLAFFIIPKIAKNTPTTILGFRILGWVLIILTVFDFFYSVSDKSSTSFYSLIIGILYIRQAKKMEKLSKKDYTQPEQNGSEENVQKSMEPSSSAIIQNAEAATDNFTLIAQNVATIFYIVHHSDFGEKITEKQKLYATALIDLYAYISNGTISVEETARSVRYATTGFLVLSPCRKDHGFLDYDSTSHVVNLAMQLEAMIFDSDTNLSRQEIVDAVVEKKPAIKNMVNQTLMQGETSPIYDDLIPYAMKSLQSKDFQSIVLSYEELSDA